MEESLSTRSISLLASSPLTQLSCPLEVDGQGDEEWQGEEKMKFLAQFRDFTMVDMSRCV